MHRVRDMDRHEERSHVRTSNGARVMASVRNLAITILGSAGETGIGAGWRHHAPGGRLRLAENLDKPAHRHRNDEPQNYKGKSPGTNEYRSNSFHHAPIVVTSICRRVHLLPNSHQGLWPLPAGLKSCYQRSANAEPTPKPPIPRASCPWPCSSASAGSDSASARLA